MTPIAIAFFAFTVVVGVASGVAVARDPTLNNFALPPLLWVFGLMALFELAVGYTTGRPLGTVVTMPQRMIGLAIGVALLMGIPYLAATR